MTALSSLIPRLLADLLLVGAALFLPWWVTLSFGALLAVFFRNFYELLAVALAIDLVFGGAGERAYGVPFFASLVAAALYLAAAKVKSELLIYR
ncbi:MAG: hypothetical protein Q8Q36_01375 [bacterium]|nr:hypothetical protein [bacterium]